MARWNPPTSSPRSATRTAAAAATRRRSLLGVAGGRVLLALLAGLSVLAATAPARPQDRGEPGPRATGGTYRRPLGSDPPSLDPVRINDIYGRAVTEQIFDGLVQFDQTLTVSPALARYWRASRDGLLW